MVNVEGFKLHQVVAFEPKIRGIVRDHVRYKMGSCRCGAGYGILHVHFENSFSNNTVLLRVLVIKYNIRAKTSAWLVRSDSLQRDVTKLQPLRPKLELQTNLQVSPWEGPKILLPGTEIARKR